MAKERQVIKTARRPANQTHIAYAVVKGDPDERWIEIGKVVPHTDGDGFTVVLDALPTNATIVCRAVSDD